MKKTVSLRTLIAIVAFFTASAVCITTMLFAFVIIPKREGELYVYNSKMLEINALVDKYYMGELDDSYMNDCVSYGYLMGLDDRYAAYIPSEEAEESMNSSFLGYNMGIGVIITQHPDTGNAYIYEVDSDGPADKAGILPGDEITAVDGYTVAEKGYAEVINYIKTQPQGQKLSVSVLRNGESLSFELELSQYSAQSVYYRMIDGKGYVYINTFNDKTVEQFKTAVDDLTAQGAEGLIFDLRGNGGGSLTSVYHIVDYLVPQGEIIRVDYKEDSLDEVYNSDAHEVDIPMVVLTDKNTASASELFTQSLIDCGKAVTVGQNTYGKGVVQRTFTLSDGSLVRFTVAKYYTASGTCVDGVGIAPDIPTEWTEDELRYRIVNGIEADKDFIAACQYLDGQLS